MKTFFRVFAFIIAAAALFIPFITTEKGEIWAVKAPDGERELYKSTAAKAAAEWLCGVTGFKKK